MGRNKLGQKLSVEEFVSEDENKLPPGELRLWLGKLGGGGEQTNSETLARRVCFGGQMGEFISAARSKLWLGKRPLGEVAKLFVGVSVGGEFVVPSKNKWFLVGAVNPYWVLI